MRRWMGLLLALLLTLGAAGAETAVSGESFVGQVTAIQGTEVTLRGGADTGDVPTPPQGERPEEQPPAGGEAPALPEGEVPGARGEAPQPPEGEAGGPPVLPGGEMGEEVTFTITNATAISVEEGGGARDGALEDITVGCFARVVFGENDTVASVTVLASGVGGFGAFGGEADNGSAARTLDEDGSFSGETYSSTGDDENALRVDGATVELRGAVIDKSGGASSSTENGDFYGLNAGLLALNGAQVTLADSTIFTSARNGNGAFCYGEGTQLTIVDTAITTLGDNSGGLQTAGGGATRAQNCTVKTSGASSAAIRSDRGGGTVAVVGGSYETGGTGSPAIYSTADISVENATLAATASEAVVVEGKNSVRLTDCAVTGNMTGTYGDSTENIHNVMLYQSTSGDAAEGLSTFAMTGGSLTANAGDMFYITNTAAEITLTGVDMAGAEGGALLRAEGNDASRGWGAAGANGARVTFSAVSQALEGDVVVDSISTLEFALSGGSTFNGTINIVANAQGGAAADENAHVVIGEGCTWTLTGDCTISTLENHGTIVFGGFSVTLADGTVVSDQT